MTAEDVCDFLGLTDGHGIRIWLDGGWAVFACLGSQTRPHSDLGDAAGRQIDFHVIVLDERGRGRYGPPGTKDYFPAEALAGRGTVNGRTVD